MAKKQPSPKKPEVQLTVDDEMVIHKEVHLWKSRCADLLEAMRAVSELKNPEARMIANHALYKFTNP